MLSTAKSALPELLRKQLSHNDVQQPNTNTEETTGSQENDSDCDVTSDSSTSGKSDYSFPFLKEVDQTEIHRQKGKWGKNFMCPLEVESSARKADFSIQSLLSSNTLTAESPDVTQTMTPPKDSPETPRHPLTKASAPTQDTTQLVNFLQLQQSLQNYGENVRQTSQSKVSLAPSRANSTSTTCPSNPKPVELSNLENPQGLLSQSFPTLPSLQPPHQMQLSANRGPFNFPSMVPRFSAAPFGLSPFRSPFNPASLSIPWLQSETFLRNLSDLAGEECCLILTFGVRATKNDHT